MSRDGAANLILLMWLGMVGIITTKQVIGDTSTSSSLATKMPEPSVFLGSAVLFTMLWGASLITPGLAVAVAAGIDISAIIVPYIKGNQTGLLQQAATWLDNATGGTPTPTTGSTTS